MLLYLMRLHNECCACSIWGWSETSDTGTKYFFHNGLDAQRAIGFSESVKHCPLKNDKVGALSGSKWNAASFPL